MATRTSSDAAEQSSTSDIAQIGLPGLPDSPVLELLPLPANYSTNPLQDDIRLDPPRRLLGPGASKFQQSALKVMQIQRHTPRFLPIPEIAGAEPGIDARQSSTVERYSNVHEECVVQVIDYGTTQSSFRRMNNKGLIEFLDSDRSVRQPWAQVRWINIGGLSWDVIRTLALKYDLHPLSVEDLFHSRQTSQSKADYYPKHLFISALCHTFCPNKRAIEENDTVDDDSDSAYQQDLYPIPASGDGGLPKPVSSVRHIPQNWVNRRLPQRRNTVPAQGKGTDEDPFPDDGIKWTQEIVEVDPVEDERHVPRHNGAGKTSSDKERRALNLQRMRDLADRLTPDGQARSANDTLINELKGGKRVIVKIRQLYIFLLRDGTLISIYRDDKPTIFGTPIVKRLNQEQTLLRSSADASLLLQSLLDLVVDNALEIVDKYHDRIVRLERAILIKPKMKTVRELHILSGDLALHKRTLAPVKSLVYGLRRYDLDRSLALIGSPSATSKRDKDKDGVIGFMSHQSKVYLADVYDHMGYILSSMDMFGSIAENLIRFTFNTISYETSEAMRRLTLATIVFLPLLFLTGYFGMNFETFVAKRESDSYFWKIAVPVLFVTSLIFMWNDLERIGLWMQKKLLRHRIKQDHDVE